MKEFGENNGVIYVNRPEDVIEKAIELVETGKIENEGKKAENFIDNLEKTCSTLITFPNRGNIPPELERLGIFEYQEIHYKPYRIIYQIIESIVYIHCVLDGRRNLQQLLQERLLK